MISQATKKNSGKCSKPNTLGFKNQVQGCPLHELITEMGGGQVLEHCLNSDPWKITYLVVEATIAKQENSLESVCKRTLLLSVAK